jgi:trigger factor
MQMGVQPDVLARHLTENGQLPAVVSEVLRTKALNLVVEHVVVTDEAGEAVDIEAIQREAAGDTGETVTEVAEAGDEDVVEVEAGEAEEAEKADA